MASENRTWTQSLYGSIAAAKFNDVQDYWSVGWEFFGSTLSPTVQLEGARRIYAQGSFTAGGATAIDQSIDWRDRILEVTVTQISNSGGGGAATDLPGGATYDPNATFDAQEWNLFGTEGGANLTLPTPTGVKWQPFGAPHANEWIYASDTTSGGITAGDLVWMNNTGNTVYLMIEILYTGDVS